MRFEELAYAVNGPPVTVQFHARLTMVSVPGADERAAWIARVLGVLEGIRSGDGASVVTVEGAGRRIRLERDDQGGARLTNLATGAELPYDAGHLSLDGRFDWFASVRLRSRTARELMVVDPAAFTGDEEFDVKEAEAKLNKAREQLARVEGQRQAAIAAGRHLEDLRRRLAQLDEEIRREAHDRVLRRKADATEAIGRLEAELAMARGIVPPERAEAEAVLAAARTAEEWLRAARTVADARRAFGRRSRLDGDSQARALAQPTEVPTDLNALVRACRAAAERRDELVTQLDASEVRTPSADSAAASRELVEEVEPAYVDALAALANVCRPFGISIDAARLEAAGIHAAGIEAVGTEAVAEVAARAAEARHARLQQALEEAESEWQAAQERIELHLAGAGLPAGGTDDLAARVKVAMDRAGEATSLLAIPVITRSPGEVEADLDRARAVLAEPPTDPADDTGPLVVERSRLLRDLRRAERGLPDVAQLADRHATLERRVASLEATFSAGGPLPTVAEAETVLRSRVAQAGRVGRRGGPLPLLVNDALATFVASDKWALLDVLADLGETTQIVYLTDDADTLSWAAGRVGTGKIALWRPDGLAAAG